MKIDSIDHIITAQAGLKNQCFLLINFEVLNKIGRQCSHYNFGAVFNLLIFFETMIIIQQ